MSKIRVKRNTTHTRNTWIVTGSAPGKTIKHTLIDPCDLDSDLYFLLLRVWYIHPTLNKDIAKIHRYQATQVWRMYQNCVVWYLLILTISLHICVCVCVCVSVCVSVVCVCVCVWREINHYRLLNGRNVRYVWEISNKILLTIITVGLPGCMEDPCSKPCLATMKSLCY